MTSSDNSKLPHLNTIAGTSTSFTQSTEIIELKTSQSNNNLTNSAAASQTTYNNIQIASSPASIDKSQETIFKNKNEFDLNKKNLRDNLNDVLKCFEQRSEANISIIHKLQYFFKKRAEIEARYSKDLEKLVENIYANDKSEKKLETWNRISVQLWESLLNETKQSSKDHQALSEVCSDIGKKFNEKIKDVKCLLTKCKSIIKTSYKEIVKIIDQLHDAMKTYHQYQRKWEQRKCEKLEIENNETKIKALKARNEYILSIDSVNVGIKKYYNEDVDNLIKCMDFRFIQGSIAECINLYISGQQNIKESRKNTMGVLTLSISKLNSNTNNEANLDSNANVFNLQINFQYEPYKVNEVSKLTVEELIRNEMVTEFEQLETRLQTLKTEQDEIYKKILKAENELLNQNNLIASRPQPEDYGITKFVTNNNLIARLEAQHSMMKKALNQPKLFGGDLIYYLNKTGQEIPLIVTSCIKAIKRLGLHIEGIFREVGSQETIKQFKATLESGEDPLINVNNPNDIHSIVVVLKSYFRELENPLFPDDKFEALVNIMTATSECEPVEQEQQKIKKLKEVIDTLPDQIYVVMRYLFAFLNHLLEFKEENKMDSYNLAVCISTSLIRVKYTGSIFTNMTLMNKDHDSIKIPIVLTKLMIENHYDIFSKKSIKGPIYEKCERNDNEENESEEEDESEKHMIRSISAAAGSLHDAKINQSSIATVMLNQQQSSSSLHNNWVAVSPNESTSTTTSPCSSKKFDPDLNFVNIKKKRK